MKNLHCACLYFRCKRPVCYTCMGSSKEDTFTMNGFKYSLVRHVSFVDCPGHDILMATMLNGAAVMDAALLLIGTKKPYVLFLCEGIIQSITFALFTENYTTLLFLAGNEPCPQPQTSEHLAAIEIMKLKHILILQNKIDLIKEEQAKQQQQEILR